MFNRTSNDGPPWIEAGAGGEARLAVNTHQEVGPLVARAEERFGGDLAAEVTDAVKEYGSVWVETAVCILPSRIRCWAGVLDTLEVWGRTARRSPGPGATPPRDHIDRPHTTIPPCPVPSRASGASPASDRYVFAPTPAIRDPGMALRLVARLMAESPGTDVFVVLSGWMQRRYPHLIYEPTGPGYAIGGFFDRFDELACELRRIMGEVSVYACPNPAIRSERGSLRNRFGRLGDGQGIKVAHIDITQYIIIYIYAINRRHGENARRCQHEAAQALMRAVLAGEPSIARSCLYGSSGNGTFLLVRLPDLSNDARNQAAVRSFVQALARKYPPSTIPIPEAEILAGPDFDRYTGAEIDKNTNVAKTIGLPGSLKCRGPHLEARPRRVVELAGLDRPIEPFDLFGWLTLNNVLIDIPEPQHHDGGDGAAPPADSSAPVSKASLRRKARAAREWLGRQAPARSGDGGDEYTFSIVCQVVYRCWGLGVDELLGVLRDWNARCQPLWTECELRHKVEEAIKVVEPPPPPDPLANYIGIGFGDANDDGGDTLDG